MRKGLLLLPMCFSISLLLRCSAGVQNIQWHSSEHVLTGTLMSIFSGKFCQCPKLTSHWFSSTSIQLPVCQPRSTFPQQTSSKDIQEKKLALEQEGILPNFSLLYTLLQSRVVNCSPIPAISVSFRIAAANFLAPGFVEDNVSTDRGWGGGFRMIQANYIFCALYFYYYYIVTCIKIII